MRTCTIGVLAATFFLLSSVSNAQDQTSKAVERAILERSNAFRASEKVGSLKADPVLMSVAQNHARNMARQDKYGDTDENGHILDGEGPVDRIKAAGYEYAAIAENVAFNKGYEAVAAEAMKAWINSPGHRRNLLTKDFTETGVGAAQGESGRWYFCQVFGRPASLMTRVKAQIANQTESTITFKIDDKEYSLDPRVTGTYMHSKSSGPITYRIQWPNGGGEAKGELKDQTKYALLEEDGKFSFRKLGGLE